jgi:hypothetical protein
LLYSLYKVKNKEIIVIKLKKFNWLKMLNGIAHKLNNSNVDKRNFFVKKFNIFVTNLNIEIRRKKEKLPPLKKEVKPLDLIQTYKSYRRRTNNISFRKKVFAYHENECWCCGAKKVKLQIHHIIHVMDNPRLALEVLNTILLCAFCHTQFHKDDTEARNKLTVKREMANVA